MTVANGSIFLIYRMAPKKLSGAQNQKRKKNIELENNQQ